MSKLGPQPDWLSSSHSCTFNPDPAWPRAAECGKPPTTHIMLRDDDGYIAACEEHAPSALVNMPVIEWHPWQAWCNMPGALWHHSPTPDEADSWCALDDGTGDRELVGAIEAPA